MKVKVNNGIISCMTISGSLISYGELQIVDIFTEALMKNILSNIWTKRIMAISVLYAACVCRLAYLSIFYDIHIKSRSSLCLTIIAVSLIAVLGMLNSRKQIVTRVCSVIILIAMLPVTLLYFGEWSLLIPILVTGVVIFLASGAGEGAKTVWGTIILLMYIFGSIGVMFATNFKLTLLAMAVVPVITLFFSLCNSNKFAFKLMLISVILS